METILSVLGRFHPVVVHFPIGILFVAFLFECMTLMDRWEKLRAGIVLLVYFGAISVALSSALGYALSLSGDYSGNLVDLHFYFGLGSSFFSILTALLLYRSSRSYFKDLRWYRMALFATTLLIGVTGHFGGSLTHGEDFLFGPLSEKDDFYNLSGISTLHAELKGIDSLSTEQYDKLNLEVRAIFAHNCYQCHSEYKRKGGLALDSKRGVFSGAESGSVIVSGSPMESELSRRVHLPSDHKEVMPKKGKTLKKAEIDLIDLWISKGAKWSDKLLATFAEAPLELEKPTLDFETSMDHPVDKIVDRYFKDKGLKWPKSISDRDFIRRAYLDITGLLPSPDEVSQFIKDPSLEKREVLIDNLLSDKDNYTQHWLTFWNDILRNDYSGPGFITGGRKEITDWLYSSLMNNVPYDTMIQDLVNPNTESEGFIKGIKWRGVVNASQRTEMQAAQNIGQSLMGVNVKCASCHNSFVSNVTLKQAYDFAAIFADTLLELNRCDKPTGVMSNVSFLYNELGSVEAETVDERLELLADVMVKPENGRLYRTFANRIWEKLLGRGLVEPVDEMDEEPWNQELLDWLAADFIESGTNIKELIRTIMTSQAYQLRSVSMQQRQDVYNSEYVFKGPIVRRLSAEQFADAISRDISPMFYGVGYDPCDEGLSPNRIWHKELKFDREVFPEPGVRYFRFQFDVDKEQYNEANVLISVDHSYRFYMNDKKLAEGENWRKVEKIDVLDALVSGKNTIAIEAKNEGETANPAGILFALRMVDRQGIDVLLEVSEEWKSTDTIPEDNWKSGDFDDSEWKEVKNYGSSHWDKLLDYNFYENDLHFARASIVKQHPFLKALGRPTRENVATTRDQQATLLQALELTNGEFLNTILKDGSEKWLERYGNDTEYLSEKVYLQLLSRQPSKSEQRVIKKSFDDKLQSESLQDLFWSVLLSPEFQFIN